MELTTVMERLAKVPDRYRRFAIPASGALHKYRVPRDVLKHLLELGLPHTGGAGGPLFDREDLKTVVLMLGLPSPNRAALTVMARTLAAGGRAEVNRTLTVQGVCPEPGHPGGCAFTLAPALFAAGARPAGTDTYEVKIRLAGGHRLFDLTPAERRLFDEVCRFQFHHVPYELNRSLRFMADSGLADCTLATNFLVARGRELGVAIRPATGLFLAKPFATTHHWVELRREDGWWPADPFYLTALARWGVLDAAEWPPHRSPLGAYWRLDLAPGEQLITHVGALTTVPATPQRSGPGYLFIQ
ncbi:hypothetical protein Acy02nite_40680 [Actinoplanes cyaneus]|uniref:Transglutaminase-like domain-containing protein n=1 Tax=Actinoplanes cyaneus TaxID=52696 RepID=A0A919M510_9ACTN|nr:transglutaminase domain-containing protein [Actinoplanes cyaneus]MCW2138229.1 Transglutaminase-like superfamily protein [Actinoplanes cyaneus]GID66187.1 hypothetical protein Acy02nite_40680 [Actinoplanes cyaneus]